MIIIILFFLTITVMNLDAMKNQNNNEEQNDKKIFMEFKEIIVTNTVFLRPLKFSQNSKALCYKNDANQEIIEDHLEIDLMRYFQYQLNKGCSLWRIYESNNSIGFFQLTMADHYTLYYHPKQHSHPKLLIYIQENSLPDELGIKTCARIIDHCFNVFNLDVLEMDLASKYSKLKEVREQCGFFEKIDIYSTGSGQSNPDLQQPSTHFVQNNNISKNSNDMSPFIPKIFLKTKEKTAKNLIYSDRVYSNSIRYTNNK